MIEIILYCAFKIQISNYVTSMFTRHTAGQFIYPLEASIVMLQCLHFTELAWGSDKRK